MEPLNNVDIVILIGFAISMLVAFIRGFVKEVLSILGLAIFIVLIVYLSPVILPWFGKYISSPILAQIVIFLLIMAIFYAIWIISTDKLIARIRTSTLSFMDRLFGLIFGIFRALLILGFCFLIIKVVLPEELKKGIFKESKFFVMAQTTSDFIEKMLPDKFIEDTVKSFENMNKVEKKKEETKEEKKDTSKDESKENGAKDFSSKVDSDKMFEQFIKPEIKTDKKKAESTGYDNKEIKDLDRLIDINTKN